MKLLAFNTSDRTLNNLYCLLGGDDTLCKKPTIRITPIIWDVYLEGMIVY